MMYYLIIALQIYCVYHAYKNRSEWYWYLVIFLIPAIGCAIYLITHVINKNDINKVQNEMVTVLNPTKRVKDLEKKVAFSDTFQNRLDLADAYLDLQDYPQAIEQYRLALQGQDANDYYGNAQLIKALYKNELYKDVVTTAQRIETHSDFDKSESNMYYGLATAKTGDLEKAEMLLKKINKRYSNYEERLMLANFLKDNGKIADAKELVNDLMGEGAYLTKPNQRKYRAVFNAVAKLEKELS
ncbi:hypothetical protein SCB49_03084 [unidentified eubacterium SCB49]|nr:hypothetical protein SCB49_03084 [unidentified eubacterium SCB49]